MASAEKETMIYEGKAKKLWSVKGNPDLVIQEFKNDATAFNGEKRGSWEHKGEVNNQLASALFQWLETEGITTHFVEMLSPNEHILPTPPCDSGNAVSGYTPSCSPSML